MFHKVHIRLTVLFTAVSSLILISMSILFLYFQTQNLYQNTENKFQQDIRNFLFSFENNIVMTHDWLISIQSTYAYDFYIYDNGIPMRFMKDTKSEEELQFIEQLTKAHPAQKDAVKNSDSTSHTEFFYKKGQETYIVSIMTLFGKDGNTAIYVVSSLQKIYTQLKHLYLQFAVIMILGIILLFLFSWVYTKKLLRPIQESQERQTQFIAAASHEIRNPVNTILSALGAMEQAQEEQCQEFLTIAKKEGKRLTYLTNDLLTLAQSDSHAFPMHFGRTELDTILLECYEAFLQPAREKQITLSVTLPEEPLISEYMDGERIRQVLSILLDNAVSYTPEYGKITLKCKKTKQYFLITIADNGIGLNEEQKQHVFERFYRADPSRHSKAHFGLGLSIAKEIINFHGGKITVTDTLGGGTTFFLRLPITSKFKM